MSTGKVDSTVYVKLLCSWLASCLQILEIFWVIRALSPTTTTRWHIMVGYMIHHDTKMNNKIFYPLTFLYFFVSWSRKHWIF